jgi:o-succinylbenzoate synthase
MKIVRAELTRVRLRLRTPLATARGLTDAREGVLLALTSESALVGHGETLPLAGFSEETPSRAFETLSGLARVLIGREIEELDALLDMVETLAPEAPTTRAAVDVALFDLAARAQGVGVAELLARPERPRTQVEVNALVYAEQPEIAAREASAAVAGGYRTVKLKVGALALDLDEARIAAVRDAVGSETKIRLDANGGWKERDAEQAIARFAPYRIEFLEQPVDARNLGGLARLSAGSPIPIAADEALAGGYAVDEIFARDAASVLILKPAARARTAIRCEARKPPQITGLYGLLEQFDSIGSQSRDRLLGLWLLPAAIRIEANLRFVSNGIPHRRDASLVQFERESTDLELDGSVAFGDRSRSFLSDNLRSFIIHERVYVDSSSRSLWQREHRSNADPLGSSRQIEERDVHSRTRRGRLRSEFIDQIE